MKVLNLIKMNKILNLSIMFFKKDYFSNDYDEKTSKINLYYRKLIED